MYVADGLSAEAGQPSQVALHDPAVASQVLASLDTTAGDPRCDATGPALAPTPAMIVALIRVKLSGSTPRATTPAGAHARPRVKRGSQHVAVVAVGSGEYQAKRRAVGARDYRKFRVWAAG